MASFIGLDDLQFLDLFGIWMTVPYAAPLTIY